MGREKKRKEKKREGEKKEGERGIRAGITALIAEPVGHAWRLGVRERDARVLDTGVGTSFSGIGRSEQGGFRKTGVRVLRRGLELNDEAKF
jgi:hypothetical protein